MTTAVVTGLSVVCAAGVGAEEFWASVSTGRTGLTEVDRFAVDGYPVTLAGQADGFTAREHLPDRLLAETDRWSHLGVFAADQALADARITPGRYGEFQMSVLTASSAGGTEFGQREMTRLWSQGPEHVGAYQSIAWFYAASAGQISIRHGMRGPCGVLVNEQAGSLDVFGQARRWLREDVPMALVGGTDAPLCPYGWVAMATNGALSPDRDPARAYRPFRSDASGYVPGEGGAMLVVERADTAAQRGAGPGYGTIAGQAATFDPRPGSARPPALARAIELALADARLGAADVDVVFADASGAPGPDRAEAAALRSVFGPGGVPVTAPKALYGRLFSGGGAVDIATALLCMRTGVIPPSGPDEADPSLDLDLVVTHPRPARVNTALVLARGWGGFNSALIVRAPGR